MYKRIFAFLLLVAVIVSVCGCSKSESKVPTDTGTVSLTDENGVCLYRVIRPEDGGVTQVKAAASVFKKAKELFVGNIFNHPDSEPYDGTFEIAVGLTNRESTSKALELLAEKGNGMADGYIICTVGNDIAIVGNSEEATLNAVERFVSDIMPLGKFEKGIIYLYDPESPGGKITLCGTTRLDKVKVVRPRYNVSYLTTVETENFISYAKEKTGYALTVVNDCDVSGIELKRSKENEYEIVIGNCDRDGVHKISNRDEYEIRAVKNRIFVNGGSPIATSTAVSELLEEIKKSGGIADGYSVTGNYSSIEANYPSEDYYKLTWGDDFDGETIDESKWEVAWGERSGYEDRDKPTYRGNPDLINNYVSNGSLYICALETDDGYYGGMLRTDDIMRYKYGYIELSTVHPKGKGFWTALWMNSDHAADDYYFLETDVDECFGEGTWAYGNTAAWLTRSGRDALDIPSDVSGTVWAQYKRQCTDDRGYFMDYHTFGFEWLEENRIRITCDGIVNSDYELTKGELQIAYSQPAYLMLSMSVGSTNLDPPTTDPAEWTETNKYIVDYVHIYQKKGQELLFRNKTTGVWMSN